MDELFIKYIILFLTSLAVILFTIYSIINRYSDELFSIRIKDWDRKNDF